LCFILLFGYHPPPPLSHHFSCSLQLQHQQLLQQQQSSSQPYRDSFERASPVPYKDSHERTPTAGGSSSPTKNPVISRLSMLRPQKSFDRPPANPEDERKLAQLKGELEHVNSIIQTEDEKLKKLAWEFEEKNNDETSEFEKEARKIRENIRAWELKQWKLTERIEKAIGEGTRSEIREQDEEGNDVKIIMISEGKKIVSAATKDLLVALMVDETNSDLNYVDDFLMTYRLYMTPANLLEKMAAIFQACENKDAAIFRFTLVMKKWIERCWRIDFELEGLQESFGAFFQVLLPYLKKAGKDTGEFDLLTVSKILSGSDFGRPKSV